MPASFNLALEQAKARFRYALYSVFGVYSPHETEKPAIFPVEKSQEADLAVSELFNSGAVYYFELLKDKLNSFQPYTKEYLEIEQEIPTYKVAAEYIAGVKSRENSKILAVNALTEYVKEAKEFAQKSNIPLEQINNALEYINKYYHLAPKE